MACEKCGYDVLPDYAYCPVCGSKTDLLKSRSKGLVIIRSNKALICGIAAFVLGIAFLVASFFVKQQLLISIMSLICLAIGGGILVKGHQTAYETTEPRCRFCSVEMDRTWQFCYRCGSKAKHKEEVKG